MRKYAYSSTQLERLLLVADDARTGTALTHVLHNASYAVDWVANIERALSALCDQAYDAVVFGLSAAETARFDIMNAARSAPNAPPVLILSLDDVFDEGLTHAHGDEQAYVLKPHKISYLLRQIRSVVRHSRTQSEEVLSNGNWVLNPTGRIVITASGSAVRLSSREFALLHALLVQPGAILSRSELGARLYGWSAGVECNVIDFFIHSLRKKLGYATIKNVRGLGWTIPDNK